MMREIWLMLIVFLLISILGIAFALTLQKKYTAEARLSVLVGDEYVYASSVGKAGEGASPKQEQIVQSEVEIISSAQVASRVVRNIGISKLFDAKDIVVPPAQDNPEHRFNVGVELFRKELNAFASPNTTVVKLTLANKDPQVAAAALNKLIDEYLSYRREVLFEDRSSGLAGQKNQFESELEAVQREISDFLAANGVSDFDAERLALQNLLATTRQELLMSQSRLSESRGRLASSSASYSREPSQIRLSFESDNSRRRLELQQQLADLLTRYTETSQPVVDMRRRIDALDALLDLQSGREAGIVKTGPNPVRDSLATDRARAQSDVQALSEREAVLSQQVQQLQGRAMALASRRPAFEDMQRRKAVLEDQVRQFSTREASARATTRLNSISNDNIRVIERAIPPTKGKSMRKFAALGAIMFAGFTALVAGAMRALSRTNFPTPGSIGRTLGLPVLANVSR
jgi:uncharacterized protein involved in exopolysaccharide biosynthesis